MNKDAVQHERGPRKPKVKAVGMMDQPKMPAQDTPIDLSMPAAHASTVAKFSVECFPKLPPLHEQHMMLMGHYLHHDVNRLAAPSAFTPPMTLTFQRDVWQEVMARLLFTVIAWVKQIPAFHLLHQQDQTALLRGCWKELFLLGLVQWGFPVEGGGKTPPGGLDGSEAGLAEEMDKLQELLARFREMALDNNELTCLKAIALFKHDTPGLRDPHAVETLQDQAQLMLSEHVHLHYPRQLVRFGRLLLLLSKLQALRTALLERIFFRGIVGSTSIDKLIGNLLHGDVI